jgi:hypothetical protein
MGEDIDPAQCPHDEADVEVRRFPGFRSGEWTFRLQCTRCLARLSRRPLDPLALPNDADPSKVARSGLGGDGNSKRRRYEKYLRSSAWKHPVRGVRVRVLARDGYRCVYCGCADRSQLECHHVRYPERIEDTRPSDCATACRSCNQAEREWRISGGEPG